MKIGATSWQIPGTYLENVKLISPELDFVELLVYTWDSDTKLLLDSEIKSILDITDISIHLPTDRIENVKSAVDYMKQYPILNMTLHPLKPFEELFNWYFNELDEMARGKVTLENLEDESFYEFMDIVKKRNKNIQITMDYGHLIYREKDVNLFCREYSGNIKEIHFHGVQNGKDHKEPVENVYTDFKSMVERFDLGEDIPICIETFEWDKTKEIARRLKKLV